jgi:acetylornithine deacetylase
MKKVFPNASIEKNIIGEIVGFDREDKSDACEFISSLTGDNSRQVVSFGTEQVCFKKLVLVL